MSGMDGHACPTCTTLKRQVGARLNDVNDVKIKLVRVRDDDYGYIDKLRAQTVDVKARLKEARVDLNAHQAECDVALKPKGGPNAKIILPLDELRALRAEGRTRSPGVIRRNLDETPRKAAHAHVLIEGADLTWQEDALCAQTDPEAFFPDKGGSTKEAKKVCATCEVREPCLKYAMDNDERFGIFGGLSERERRKLKRRSS